MDSVLALHPAAPNSIPGVPNNFSEFLMLPRLIDGAAAQSSGQQRHNNVDQTHLVLASLKLVSEIELYSILFATLNEKIISLSRGEKAKILV